MTDMDSLSFEEKLHAAARMPQPRAQFITDLRARLAAEASRPLPLNERLGRFFLRPAWVALMVALLLVAGLFIAGPQRVFAKMRGLLGYIPGAGIVDNSAPMRVLAEPVIVVKDSIAVTVTSAVLSGESTHIEYRIFGVPGSAYPNREDAAGCAKPDYLRLPDGTSLGHDLSLYRPNPSSMDFLPVPAGVNEAVLVIPCIFDTLPGTVPENWEIPLRFVPAPPNLTVMPVIDLSPSPQTAAENPPAAESESTATPAAESPVVVRRVIETTDGYILVGVAQPVRGEVTEPAGALEVRDAGGKLVKYTIPQDVGLDVAGAGTDGAPWVVQFAAAGLEYPLTIRFPRITTYQPDPAATAGFEFDAGANPQVGQEFAENQQIQLLGHTLKLVSLSVDSRNGYNFIFEVDEQVSGASVEIAGYTPSGWGGGGKWDGQFSRSLSFPQTPTGRLKVIISGLTLIGEPVAWQGQWSPAAPRADLPATPVQQPGVCLTRDSVAQLAPLPASLGWGKALVYEKIDGSQQWGLVLYNLDGSGRQVITSSGNWGALSPTGKQVAYSGTDGALHIVQVETLSDQALPQATGFNPHWAPNGKQVGYIHLGNGVVDSAAIASVDGAPVQQVSDLSYEAIIGWAPDGSKLYFAAPYTGGAAWKIFAYETTSGPVTEQFTIENGTPKFLNPKLSRDGRWIAYRGRDNSSVYLVRPDGSDLRLLIDDAGAVGIEWSLSGWLGISLQKMDSDERKNILLNPETCEGYQLPGTLKGELQGVYMP